MTFRGLHIHSLRLGSTRPAFSYLEPAEIQDEASVPDFVLLSVL